MEQSFSPPYTPELNAVAERVNRTIIESARSMLIQADLPHCLWPYAAKHVMYVRNRVKHSTTGTSPFILFYNERPSLKYVRVFGCVAYVLKPLSTAKFDAKATEGVYLESLDHGVFRILICNGHNMYRIIESRHVTFDETRFIGAPGLEEIMDDEISVDHSYENSSDSGNFDSMDNDNDSATGYSCETNSTIDEPESFVHEGEASPDIVDSDNRVDNTQDSDEHCDDDDNDVAEEENISMETPTNTESRYPNRIRRPPQKWYMASSITKTALPIINVTTGDEPKLRDAMSATPTEIELWKIAIDDEIKSLDEKGTWVPDPNPRVHPLPSHLVLKIKRLSDGSIERFKARAVAGGNFQVFGENYVETYAPVVSFSTVCIFLYISLVEKMYKVQMDVKTAFLNGELEEDIWIMSPHGIPHRPPRCYKLLKAMYGLKQAHMSWHKKLSHDLEDIGFHELPSAPCVFVRRGSDIGVTFLLVYVDDIIALSTTKSGIDFVISKFEELYAVHVKDEVDWFIGVKLDWRNGRKLVLSQPLYVRSILRRFGMEKANPVNTPMVESFWASIDAEDDKSECDQQLYQELIGSLLYLGLRTRFDILPAVLILSRYQSAPTSYCYQSAKHVLRYLSGTVDYGISYVAKDLRLSVFVDSDYAGDRKDRKSMTGYVVKLGGAPVYWGARKQPTVALSTCEAEYYAMATATKEVIWTKRILEEAGFPIRYIVPISSDNESAISWVTSDQPIPNRAKHIDVQAHFTRDCVRKGIVSVAHVPSDQNDADLLTKPVSLKVLRSISSRLFLGKIDEEEC